MGTTMRWKEVNLPVDLKDLENETQGEASMFSFLVRVWKEETGSQDDPVIWRGHITPVGKGERHYFRDIGEIPAFIRAHLDIPAEETKSHP